GAVKAYADSAAGTDLAQGTRTSTTVPITSSTGTSATLEVATTTLAGVMSASDKTKLDGIEAGAEVNVNADWNAVSGDAQILNKPTIPTKTSELENDSGFVTYSYIDITLDKTAINNLHTTPITITSTDLGLSPGEGAKFLKELLEIRIFTDGTDFSSTRPIQIGNGELDDIMSLH